MLVCSRTARTLWDCVSYRYCDSCLAYSRQNFLDYKSIVRQVNLLIRVCLSPAMRFRIITCQRNSPRYRPTFGASHAQCGRSRCLCGSISSARASNNMTCVSPSLRSSTTQRLVAIVFLITLEQSQSFRHHYPVQTQCLLVSTLHLNMP